MIKLRKKVLNEKGCLVDKNQKTTKGCPQNLNA
jgi:hypothetical protein